MAVYLALVSPQVEPAEVAAAPGPWSEVRGLTGGGLLLESPETLSRVYHELKWLLPDGTALIVAPVDARPKSKGQPAGTTTWLRDRLPLPTDPD